MSKSEISRRVRRALAEPLHRTAERLNPSHLQNLEVTWKRNEPPYVEINYLGGQRVAGWVHPTLDGPLSITLETSPQGLGEAAQAGLDLANEAIRFAAKEAAKIRPLKLHPTKPGHCVCGQRLDLHLSTFCTPDEGSNV